MSVIDDIRQAVASSTKLESGVKTVLGDFLEIAGPALETLGPTVVQEILNHFATGESAAATATVANALSGQQVVSTLDVVDRQMNEQVAQRTAQVAASRATMAAVESAAISVLARLLTSAL